MVLRDVTYSLASLGTSFASTLVFHLRAQTGSYSRPLGSLSTKKPPKPMEPEALVYEHPGVLRPGAFRADRMEATPVIPAIDQ